MRKIESKNGIVGVAIGDAIGLPIQFMDRKNFIKNPVTKMLGYMCFNMPKGSWSDDTSMTLATMDAIAQDGKIDSEVIMKNFVKWLRENDFTPMGKAYDIGKTCLRAIANYDLKVKNADEAGLNGEFDNGNGSLMRITPITYYCFAKELADDEIYEVVKKVSSLTHAHEISVLGCYIYVKFGLYLLQGDSLEEAYDKVKVGIYEKYFSANSIERYSRVLKENIQEFDIDEISSSGFVIDTLEATFWSLLNTKTFDEAIIKAINLGGDTDTVGACVGGLAGIYYGIDSINEEWKSDLIKFDYIFKMCKKFDEAVGK